MHRITAQHWAVIKETSNITRDTTGAVSMTQRMTLYQWDTPEDKKVTIDELNKLSAKGDYGFEVVIGTK